MKEIEEAGEPEETEGSEEIDDMYKGWNVHFSGEENYGKPGVNVRSVDRRPFVFMPQDTMLTTLPNALDIFTDTAYSGFVGKISDEGVAITVVGGINWEDEVVSDKIITYRTNNIMNYLEEMNDFFSGDGETDLEGKTAEEIMEIVSTAEKEVIQLAQPIYGSMVTPALGWDITPELMMIIGGFDEEDELSSMIQMVDWDTTENEPVALQVGTLDEDFPHAFGTVVQGWGKVYIFGGIDKNGNLLDTILEIDLGQVYDGEGLPTLTLLDTRLKNPVKKPIVLPYYKTETIIHEDEEMTFPVGYFYIYGGEDEDGKTYDDIQTIQLVDSEGIPYLTGENYEWTLSDEIKVLETTLKIPKYATGYWQFKQNILQRLISPFDSLGVIHHFGGEGIRVENGWEYKTDMIITFDPETGENSWLPFPYYLGGGFIPTTTSLIDSESIYTSSPPLITYMFVFLVRIDPFVYPKDRYLFFDFKNLLEIEHLSGELAEYQKIFLEQEEKLVFENNGIKVYKRVDMIYYVDKNGNLHFVHQLGIGGGGENAY